MDIKATLSIIIPCYNELRIRDVLAAIEAVDLGDVNKEVIIINDGSKPAVRSILEKVAERYKVIHLPKNFGKGYAVRQGIKAASGNIILIQDADLEYNPQDYSRLIQPITSHQAQVVYGSRFLQLGNKRSQYYWGVRALTLLTNILYGSRLTDEATCYKVFTANLLKSIPLSCQRFEFCPEVTAKILKKGIKIMEVPIHYTPRTISQGKKVRVKDGIIAARTLIKYYFLPCR